MDGWMDGWMDVTTILKDCLQQLKRSSQIESFFTRICLVKKSYDFLPNTHTILTFLHIKVYNQLYLKLKQNRARTNFLHQTFMSMCNILMNLFHSFLMTLLGCVKGEVLKVFILGLKSMFKCTVKFWSLKSKQRYLIKRMTFILQLMAVLNKMHIMGFIKTCQWKSLILCLEIILTRHSLLNMVSRFNTILKSHFHTVPLMYILWLRDFWQHA
jgi:hypothetical protein